MTETEYALDCYQIHPTAPEIIPGRPKRQWMDQFAARQPYRCLPLTMANSTGWEILCPFDITLDWNGGPSEKDITITSDTPNARIEGLVVSHFRSGIVTFHTGYLFRTPPGLAFSCMGPPNEPKDGIAPLSGLVETDWLPFPFTMNWQMTRPGKVTFKKDECFCFFTLTDHRRLESVSPTLLNLSDNADLKRDYDMWSSSRGDFIEKLTALDPETTKAGWQRHYMQGTKADGASTEADHLTKRRLKTPRRTDD